VTNEESLLAAIYEEVALQPHDASWPAAFRAERDRLLFIFPGKFIGIQHIGSTAVPGLLSKPVIDILAGVSSMTTADELVEPLCRSDYTTSAEFNATLPDSRWFMRWSNGRRTHHLHLAVHGSEFWVQRLRFRDALLADTMLAAKYSQLKSALALTHRTDREAYTNAKSEFIRAAIKDA
jgi:GrpB-like predicted nucleotidyltransferase (UPF0157 family)